MRLNLRENGVGDLKFRCKQVGLLTHQLSGLPGTELQSKVTRLFVAEAGSDARPAQTQGHRTDARLHIILFQRAEGTKY